MRALERIAQSFADVREVVHERRWQLVWSLVESLSLGARATVTDLGRGLRRNIREKHAIKCADRALSNRHLHRERLLWYRAVAGQVISIPRPVIAIDGTDVCAGWSAMRASVACDGRSITILNEVYRQHVMGQRKVHRHFLGKLRLVLPEACRPIVVVDGGFRRPFFEEVRNLGWDFVGRPQSNLYLYRNRRYVGRVSDLYEAASRQAVDHGWYDCAHRRRYRGRFVVYDGRSGQSRRYRTRSGKQERKRRRKASEPWALVTSCEQLSAQKIVGAYKTRMQIEETFRDDKSSRFGRALEQARCRHPARLAVMLLLLALASFLLLVVGLAAESAGLARHYRANTSARRSLSLVQLGFRVLQRHGTDLHLPNGQLTIRGDPSGRSP